MLRRSFLAAAGGLLAVPIAACAGKRDCCCDSPSTPDVVDFSQPCGVALAVPEWWSPRDHMSFDEFRDLVNIVIRTERRDDGVKVFDAVQFPGDDNRLFACVDLHITGDNYTGTVDFFYDSVYLSREEFIVWAASMIRGQKQELYAYMVAHKTGLHEGGIANV